MRPGAVLAVAAQLAACTTWQPQVESAGALVEREHPDRIRLTLLDGAVVLLAEPSIDGDSIRGVDEVTTFDRAVAVDRVSEIAVRKSSPSESVWIGILAGVLILAGSFVGFGLAPP